MLRKEIENAINRTCAENESNTPDFVLASFLMDCLVAFDKAANARDKFHGVKLGINQLSIEEMLQNHVCSNCHHVSHRANECMYSSELFEDNKRQFLCDCKENSE